MDTWAEGMMTRELKAKIAYNIAWLLYVLRIRNIAKLPDMKQLYARAMAAKWCDKKDRRFCELAFYKLYNYDVAKYLRPGETPSYYPSRYTTSSAATPPSRRLGATWRRA
jgi:hypothetical protein